MIITNTPTPPLGPPYVPGTCYPVALCPKGPHPLSLSQVRVTPLRAWNASDGTDEGTG